ncbi:serine hydrolase domain-containing protein [Streptomyces sp. AM8-1-1]|uniref:serine hydrolase domain-containing protein n=1 Tax=Streptomyces sp. AM8-1-1 TaxID=3075825 RepID=UPI0028C407C4|nr:serine hydrolase domain-containing protein [Streptomyces sp. AM8-1-1]WNO70551.1 serine hydrolase domain-containing protein [Streptomyces sp. AM8-1-1]
MVISPKSWRKACVAVAVGAALVIPVTAGGAYGAPTPDPSGSVSPSPSSTSPGSTFPNLDASISARLDTAIQQVMREAAIPGVTVAVSAPDKGTYLRTFGVADKSTGAPMDADMNMRIGSETKTFTVTALLQLVDQGKAGLDDTIDKYIDGVPNGNRITLRQLAGMRSGLFSYTMDDGFVKAFLTDPRQPFTPQQLLDYAFKHPVNFQPGAQFEYSNTNLILLGLVVEKQGGMPLQDFISKNITRPTKLRNTFLATDATFPNPHAQGYTNQTLSGKVENSTDWDPSWGWAAGAAISNLQDLRSWARILATGTLLKPATQAQRLDTAPTNIPGASYGLGIFNVQSWIGHNGSLPGYESLTMYLPEAEATLVVLLNTDILHNEQEPSTLLGQAITRIVTPDHVYNLPVVPTRPTPSATPSPTP